MARMRKRTLTPQERRAMYTLFWYQSDDWYLPCDIPKCMHKYGRLFTDERDMKINERRIILKGIDFPSANRRAKEDAETNIDPVTGLSWMGLYKREWQRDHVRDKYRYIRFFGHKLRRMRSRYANRKYSLKKGMWK